MRSFSIISVIVLKLCIFDNNFDDKTSLTLVKPNPVLLRFWPSSISHIQNRKKGKIKFFQQISYRMTVQEYECVISRLITEGSFDILIVKILTFLDFQSLVSCGKVCTLWREMTKTVIRRYVCLLALYHIMHNSFIGLSKSSILKFKHLLDVPSFRNIPGHNCGLTRQQPCDNFNFHRLFNI